MPGFERSGQGRRDFRGSSGRDFRGSRDRDSSSGSRDFRGGSRGGNSGGRSYGGGRDFDRGPKRFGNNRRDAEFTKVKCSSCGVDCEVPFVPRSDKPLFCDDCFKNNNGKSDNGGSRGSSGPSEKDLDIINEKLNKIMKALKIE